MLPANDDDHDLVRRIGQGDMAALDRLVRRWDEPVRRLLRRLAPSEAEDLGQETFVRLLLASPRYRADKEFSTWLFTIALNVARDALRKRRRREGSAERLRLNGQPLVDRHETPDRDAEQREQARLVELALARLPDATRELLVLRHFAELTFVQIAAMLGLAESTVKSRAAAALDKLAVELRRLGLRDDRGADHEL